MKKLVLSALFATSVVTTASAAMTAGFEAGYLTDREAGYYSARLGYEFKAGPTLAHSVELEIGYTEKSYTVTYPPLPMVPVPGGTVSWTEKLTPLMLNYRGVFLSSTKFSGYAGAGIGQAKLKKMGGIVNDTVLAGQGFAGVNYKASNTTLLHLGLKYLWFDDAKAYELNFPVDSDFVVSAGVSFRF